MPKYPNTRKGILRASDKFGPNQGSLKGETVYATQEHVKIKISGVSPEILERHSHVRICLYVMFLNKNVFCMRMSPDIDSVLTNSRRHEESNTGHNQQSTINNQQSTINNQQSTINNQQSTINTFLADFTFGRSTSTRAHGWVIIKGT